MALSWMTLVAIMRDRRWRFSRRYRKSRVSIDWRMAWRTQWWRLCSRIVADGRRRRSWIARTSRSFLRFHGHPLHQLLESLVLCRCLTAGSVGLVLLNLTEQLRTFSSTIVHERLDILFETVHAVFHLAVKALRSHQTLNHVAMNCENLLILVLDCTSTFLHALVFLLI